MNPVFLHRQKRTAILVEDRMYHCLVEETDAGETSQLVWMTGHIKSKFRQTKFKVRTGDRRSHVLSSPRVPSLPVLYVDALFKTLIMYHYVSGEQN